VYGSVVIWANEHHILETVLAATTQPVDVVALAQHGVSYAVATLGTATTAVHIQKLLRLSDEIVFAFDGDNAGRKAAWRALETSLPWSVDHKPMRFLFLPQGVLTFGYLLT